tara:strand:- start:2285 stop:2467 length:183 start_codon:yes stop_codon:yes gene_type:complete
MKSKISTYKPKKDEFKIAQPKTHELPGVYVPEPHPFASRMEENKKILSLWTPNKIEGSRK